MFIYKKVALAFLLLTQLVVLICHSGKLCADNHYTGNYYHVTDIKSGKRIDFYSDIPVNIDLFQRNGELQIEAFSPDPNSPSEVYRFSGGINLNSRRRLNSEALSQEYTINITPVIRTLLARSAHERFSQFSTYPDRIRRCRDTHVVTIHAVLPGSSQVSTFMDDLATVADTLVNNNVADSWQPGEISFREPNRPVLSLRFYVDYPQAPPLADAVESAQAAVRNRVTRLGNRIMDVIMRTSHGLQENPEQVSSESPAQENAHQRAYCRQTRVLRPHGQLQFNVAMSADSVGRVEQIIRTFKWRPQFSVLEPGQLAMSPSNEAVAGASSRGENRQISSGLLAVGFAESFYCDGILQRGGSDIVHFYSPRVNPPVNWFADDLDAIRGQVVRELEEGRVLNGGSQEYLIREATSPGSSRQHFRIAVELPLSEAELNSEQVPERAMSGLVENIQRFLRSLELDQHITFSWHFHDVNYTGSRVEATFFLTNYVRSGDDDGGITRLGISHLQRVSPDDWQVREWTPLYISTFTPEPVASPELRIPFLEGLMLRVRHGVGALRRWVRGFQNRSSEQRQERTSPNMDEQLGGLLGVDMRSTKF